MPRSAVWIGLLAAAVRLALMAFESGLTYDGTFYLRQAARLASGDFQWVGFPPGYPLVIAAMQTIVRDSELAARVVSLIAGVAAVVVFHVCAHRRLDARVATLASLVLAMHPELVRASSQVLSESLFVFLVLAGVAWSERRPWAASLSLGLAFLCRPEALIILGGLPVLQWLRERKVSRTWWIGFVLVATYSILASRAVGHFVISPKQGQLDLDGDLWARLWTTLRMTHAVFPLLLLPGAIWVGARLRREWLLPCLYVVFLPLYDIHVQQRLLLPALPFLIFLGALWLTRIAPKVRRVAVIASLLLLAWGIFPTLTTFGAAGIVTPRAREIGAALAQHLSFDDRVAGRFPFVSYYAGAGFVRVPLAGYDDVIDSIGSMGATHLLVLENEVTNITPQLRPLFDDAVFTGAEGRLRAVAWVDEPPGDRAILYRMRRPDLAAARAPIVRSGVQGVTWMGNDLVVASRTGLELLPIPAGAPAPDADQTQRLVPGTVRDPAASGDGQRVAFVRVDGQRSTLAVYDAGTREFVSYDGTTAHEPASPTFVGEHVLYVGAAKPRRLWTLVPRTGEVREVALQGLKRQEAAPLAVTARGDDIAVTYVRSQPRNNLQRVIATATWPAALPQTGIIELQGRWAAELSLADDHVAWLPGQLRVLATIAVLSLDGDGNVTGVIPSLTVVHSSAVYRRLSFDLDAVRRPARRETRIALITGDGDLRTSWLDPETARVPRVRVYASVLPRP